MVLAATVSGVVTDSETEGAIEGAVVQLRTTGGGPGQAIGTDTTDATGAFLFEEVEAGNYSVLASMDGYVTATVQDSVEEGEEESVVSVVLSPVVMTTVSGTVTDEAGGSALEGAVVQFRTSGGRGQVIGRDTTGADGVFSFSEVESGTYSLLVTLDGYMDQTETVEVATADPVMVDVVLSVPVFTMVSGSVTDETGGSALEGAVVQLRTSGGRGQVIGTDTTGADGTFSFLDVETGTYSLQVAMSGYESQTATVEVASEDPVTTDVMLTPITVGSITGTVTAESEEGDALEGVTVILRTSGGGGTAIDTATTDANGVYTFEEVTSGSGYTIAGSLEGYNSGTVNLRSKGASVDTVDLVLEAIVIKDVTVIVLSAADSSAIEGAAVIITASSGMTGISLLTSGTSDASGALVAADVEEGTYTISATADGFTGRSGQLRLSATSNDTVTLYLEPAEGGTKTVTGTVTDSTDESVLGGVTVTLRIGGGGGNAVVLAATTDEDGTFTITGIPVTATSATLAVSLGGYITESINVDLGAADEANTTTVEVALLDRGAGVVTGQTVILNAGRPGVVLYGGLITVSGFTGPGVVKVFSLNGKMLLHRDFTGIGKTQLAVPQLVGAAENIMVVRVAKRDGGKVIVGTFAKQR